MTASLTPAAEAAERIIAQSAAAEAALAKRPGIHGATARLRIAALPGVIRGLAAEADAGLDADTFYKAVVPVIASIASSYAGFFGAAGVDRRGTMQLLIAAADMVASADQEPDAHMEAVARSVREGDQ